MASRTPAQHPSPIRIDPPPRRERTGGHDLPAPLTSLIGRGALVATLTESLRDGVRLLTLTGPGGVGKTRLALAVAAAAADHFADGVAFVPLAPIRDSRSLASAIAQTLQIPQRIDRPVFDDLKEALRDERLLLVLDNFEHLSPSAPLLTDLLQLCPFLSLLVTSRIRLHLSGEHDVPVPLLPLPDPSSQQSVSNLRASPSARLFEERAAAVLPGFAITSQNAQSIAAICHRLDGLPLAIELAAARAIVLTPPALLARLNQRLPVLTGGPVDAPDRLRTMRDAIAWSHDLLSLDDQTLFRRLSVFVGGFSLEAAEHVAGGQGDRTKESVCPPVPQSPSVLDGMTALIEASLVQRIEAEGDEARFRMLETVREFAAEQLAELGERDTTVERLVDWCLELVAAADRAMQGAEQERWFRLFEVEQANLKAAIGWALERGRAETALRLINGPLWYFWSMRGWARGERPWLERGIALAESVTDPAGIDPLVLARAYLSDGLFFLQTGGYQEARGRFEASLALYRTLGDAGRGGAAMALGNLATLDNDQGDYLRAAAYLDEALEIRRSLGIPLMIGVTLVNLGNVANLRGDHEAAIRLLDEALTILREVGTPRPLAFCLNNLGEATAGLGHDGRAMAFFEQALGLLRRIGDPNGEGFALVNVAAAAIRLGDPPRAADALAGALAGQHAVRNPVVIADALETVAELAVVTGRPLLAPRFLAGAAAVREGARTVLTPIARRRVERVTGAARATLGRGPFEAATIGGRASTVEETVESALVFLRDLGGDRQPLTEAADGEAVAESPAPEIALTARQREVLRLLVDGLSDPEIAGSLAISTRTVETHVAGILNKLGLHSRTAAVAYAVRHRLV